MGRNIADPQSWNRYLYVRNNPLRYVDPDGRSWWSKLIKLGIKGGDVAATVKGNLEDFDTLIDADAGVGWRVLAGLSLASEVLPVSARDVREVGGAALSAVARGGVSRADDLAAAASRARNTVGPGSGGAYGTRVHSAFEAEVNGLGRGLQTEVSYLNGQVVPRGTPGSVRLDVVNGPLNAPTSIFDLKTGSATLTPGRIQQIQSHVPGGGGVPVFEVRP
jgi:hypothetical protein